MTDFAIDVPRMFVGNGDGKYAACRELRAQTWVSPVLRLDQSITILSGR